MRVPKRFFLAGIPITIELDDTYGAKHGASGMACYSEQKIILDPHAVSKETYEQTALHEICHFILYIMNRHELRNEEAFVDMFSHLLYQYLETAEYDEKGIGVSEMPDKTERPLTKTDSKQPKMPKL